MATKATSTTKAAEVKIKLPDITNLATRSALNAKVTEIEKNM